MKKQSSYQKLKAENRRLKQDIYDLVMKGNELDGFFVWSRYRIKFVNGDLIWFGSREPERPEPGIGIMAQIKHKK